MPTAADAPVRNDGARLQNTGLHAFNPIADAVKAAIFSTGSLISAAAATPTAASVMAARRCPLRSILRSERRPHQIIAAAPAAGGMMDTHPVCMSVRPKLLTIVGRKKPTPNSNDASVKHT